MNLEPHGWLDVLLISDAGERIEIPVSFLTDAIHDWAEQISRLKGDVRQVTIVMQTEPGEYRARISKISDQEVRFELLCMNDNFSSQPNEAGKKVFDQNTRTIKLKKTVYRELTKLKNLGADEYKKRWAEPFPSEAYEKIDRSLGYANSTKGWMT